MSFSDEKTSLLSQQQQQRHQQQQHHIINVPVIKDCTEYETIFSTADYTHGLTLDELLLYVDDPKWQFMRRTLIRIFWFVLLSTFLAGCALAYRASHDTATSCGAARASKPTIQMYTSATSTMTTTSDLLRVSALLGTTDLAT